MSVTRRTVFAGALAAGSLCAVSAAAAGSGVRSGRLSASIQAYLDRVLVQTRAPGATAAVVLEDGSVMEFATGLADVERQYAMTPEARMPAGSIGKSYVAALAGALADEGVIDLDAPILRYVGQEAWFAEVPNGRDLTLNMLLNHTAGLAEWFGGIPPQMGRAEFHALFARPRPWIEYLRFSFATAPRSRPGELFSYADTNFMLAAMVIEAATGRDYDEDIVSRFIYPLRLNQTAPADSRFANGQAQGYVDVEGTPLDKFLGEPGQRVPLMRPVGVLPFNPRFEGAGGGYTSTAGDVARWAKLLYEDRTYNGSYVTRALASFGPQSDETRRIGPYGLGMFVWDPARGYAKASTISGKQYGHLGTFPGYSAAMKYFPQLRVAVVVMFNANVTGELRHAIPAHIADLVATAQPKRKRPG